MKTAIRQHQWVLHVICPVDVISNTEEGCLPSVFVDPDKRQAAEENAVYGCMACSTPLTRESVDTECPGSDCGE